MDKQELIFNLRNQIENFEPVPFDLGQAMVDGFSEHEEDIKHLNKLKQNLAELLGLDKAPAQTSISKSWEVLQDEYENQ